MVYSWGNLYKISQDADTLKESKTELAKFFLQMMDRLFDCLFYIDNVDLLGENCQAATDGFIMRRHNTNINYDMPAVSQQQAPHQYNISQAHSSNPMKTKVAKKRKRKLSRGKEQV